MTLRIAPIGAGSVARRHVDVLHGLGGARVVSVTDPHAPSAEALAAELDAAAFQDPDQALDAVAADAVYVCVPPFAHGPGERAALRRGLPLFVEKPVGLGLDVAEEVGAMVEEAGVVTGTGYHWRCLDTAAADAGPVRALGDGVAGRLVLVTGAGPIGLLTALCARSLGAREVAVADADPRRRALAERLGFLPLDLTDDPGRTLETCWRHGPGDHGADVVFQCRGRSEALHAALCPDRARSGRTRPHRGPAAALRRDHRPARRPRRRDPPVPHQRHRVLRRRPSAHP